MPPRDFWGALFIGTAGVLVMIIALSQPASAATRVEDTDTTRITYTGTVKEYADAKASGGTYRSMASDAKAAISAAVDGTATVVYIKVSSSYGTADVRRNGVKVTTISSNSTVSGVTYENLSTPVDVVAGDLIELVVTSGASDYIYLDAFDMNAATTTPTDTTAPATPTGLTGTAGDGKADLTWTANTESDLAGYRVWRDGVKVADPTTASYSDTPLTNGTTYSYEIAAVDTAGNVSARTAAVAVTPAAATTTPTDTTAPATPTGLTGTAGDGKADLTWTANTESDLAGYRVWRDGVKVADPTTASYSDTPLTNGTTYSYEIAAVDTAGNVSARTAPVTVTPAAAATGGSTGSTGVTDVRLVEANESAMTPMIGVLGVGFGLQTLMLTGLLVAQLRR